MYKDYSTGHSPFRRKIFDTGRALEISAYTCSLCRAFWDALCASGGGQIESSEPVFLRFWVHVGGSTNYTGVPLGLSSFTVHHGPQMASFALAAAEGQ
jgi:hypothetical protein